MKVALGSDHRGYAVKERLKMFLQSRNVEFVDFGTVNSESFDYPDAALPAAEGVAKGDFDRAILMCGTGIGMSISANKVKGVRASLCHDDISAELARRHNNANVLCLPCDLISNIIIERVVDVWLNTPFEGGRHERRINKINDYESHDGQHSG